MNVVIRCLLLVVKPEHMAGSTARCDLIGRKGDFFPHVHIKKRGTYLPLCSRGLSNGLERVGHPFGDFFLRGTLI
jgi:hypothetical protein